MQREAYDTHMDKPCDICGHDGYEELLKTCSSCHIARQHVYCMRAHTRVVPQVWVCEACEPESCQEEEFLGVPEQRSHENCAEECGASEGKRAAFMPSKEVEISNATEVRRINTVSMKKRRTDPAWKYVLPKDGKNTNSITCLFCNKTFRAGISRHKLHLTGGARAHVVGCKNVPTHVEKEIRELLEKQKMAKARGNEEDRAQNKVVCTRRSQRKRKGPTGEACGNEKDQAQNKVVCTRSGQRKRKGLMAKACGNEDGQVQNKVVCMRSDQLKRKRPMVEACGNEEDQVQNKVVCTRSSQRKRKCPMAKACGTEEGRVQNKIACTRSTQRKRKGPIAKTCGNEEDPSHNKVICTRSIHRKRKGAMDKFVAPRRREKHQRKGNLRQTTIKETLDLGKVDYAHQCIARWFYQAGISFNAARLHSFKVMIEAIGVCPGLKPPRYHDLIVPLLKIGVDFTHEQMIQLQEESIAEGNPLSEAQILKKVLGKKSAYVKGQQRLGSKSGEAASRARIPETIDLKQKVDRQEKVIAQLQSQNAEIMKLLKRLPLLDVGS